jgi:hypothetical protein
MVQKFYERKRMTLSDIPTRRNFVMARLSNESWTCNWDGKPISLSVTLANSNQIGVIAVCASAGIGSIYDATEMGVECHLGSRGDGISEAFAKSLLRITGCKRVILSLAIPNISSKMVKSILDDIKTRISIES